MSSRQVYLNGEFVPEHQASVSIYDAGLLYGEFAFEMTRTFHGVPFRLTHHLERLLSSLRYLEIEIPWSLEELLRLTMETLARNRATEADDVEWHIRHDVSRGIASPYQDSFSQAGPTLCISCYPLIKQLARFATLYREGVEIVSARQPAIPPELIDPRAKTRSRVHFQIAQREAGTRWPVLLDPQGFVTEGPSWNVFLVRDGTIYSPQTGHILSGVSRQVTMESANRLGIPITESPMKMEDLRTADEVFCTATSFGIVRAQSVDGHRIPEGEIVSRLGQEWNQTVGLDMQSQANSYAERLEAWIQKERPS